MSWRKNRPSKFRFICGRTSNKSLYYDNVKVTNNAWDSNIVETNGKYISLTWKSTGGGSFAVIPIDEVGKFSDDVPLFKGHTGPVLDTNFDPFCEDRIASASEDGNIGIWLIPETYSFRRFRGGYGINKCVKPVTMLASHTKKVGHVLFHPIAKDVLASCSLDCTVKIWDLVTEKCNITLEHSDMVTSMCFSFDGCYLATVTRDRMLRVWNIRKQKVISQTLCHEGVKKQRVIWLGDSDRLATTGFSKIGDRQVAIWDPFDLEQGTLSGFYDIDFSSSILMPFYDDCNKILYLVGKGDGNIRYCEFRDDKLFELSEFSSTESQRGFAITPRRMVDIRHNEVLKGFKTVQDRRIEPISFIMPRKAEGFPIELYSDAPSDKPALSSTEWFSGKSVDGPILINMKSIYENTEPIFTPFERKTSPSPKKIANNENIVNGDDFERLQNPKSNGPILVDITNANNNIPKKESDNEIKLSSNIPHSKVVYKLDPDCKLSAPVITNVNEKEIQKVIQLGTPEIKKEDIHTIPVFEDNSEIPEKKVIKLQGPVKCTSDKLSDIKSLTETLSQLVNRLEICINKFDEQI